MAQTQAQVLGIARPMDRGRLLSLYLRDHLASAHLAVLLARRTLRNNEQNAVGELMERLVPALERDRETLREVARAVGVREGALRRGGVWVGEKLGRLKLNGRLLSYSPLSRIFELEGLLMLAAQRHAMWLALERHARVDRRLSGIDLSGRAQTSGEERRQLEQQLLAASIEIV